MKINQLYKGKKTEISIVAHLQSIMNDSELNFLEYLLEFNLSNNISVEVIPDIELYNTFILNRFKIQKSNYAIINQNLCLESTNTRESSRNITYITSHFSDEKKVSYSNISNWDIHYFDLKKIDIVVVGKKDLDVCKAENIRSFPTDVYGALELLRLFLLKRQQYEICPRHTCNRSLYYLYYMKRRIRNYQDCWSIATYSRDTALISRLRSIGSRTQYILESLDFARIEFLAGPNVDTINTFAYHFSFLMMLATGLLDDYAHFFNQLYNLELKKFDIILRVLSSKKHSELSKKISKEHPKIARLIESKEYKALVELIYQLRDRYQHRLFLSSSEASSFNFEIDNQFTDSIAHEARHILIENKVIHNGSEEKKYSIDMENFLDYFEEYYFPFINIFCDEVDLSKYFNTLDKEIKDKLIKNCEDRKQAPWTIVGIKFLPTILEHKFIDYTRYRGCCLIPH